MKYNEAIEFVNNLEEFRYKFGLERIKSFLNLLGNPQDKIKIIHVAGTNGKGSVCAYISTVLQKAGYKVGLYTSPHILDMRERLRINRKKIPKKDFTNFITHYTSHITQYSLTYFELLTAMAFWYLERERVDFAVIEVGLGGRLDATNVIKNPLVSVITNISLEHTQYLGNTVSKIAGEKAGIIKNNGVVITGTSGVALRTIEKIAKIKKAKVIKPINPALPEGLLRKGGVNRQLQNYKISMFGAHQKENANLSAAVCRLLDIPEKYIIDGLQNTVWPARFDVRQLKIKNEKLKIILDVAHNPSGIKMLKDSIKKYFGKKVNFVFGVLSDKDYKSMIKIISSVAKNVFISAPKNERALSVEIMKKEFTKYISQKNIFVFDDIKNAVKSAIKKSEDFCVTGSVYTVAEAMKCLTGR